MCRAAILQEHVLELNGASFGWPVKGNDDEASNATLREVNFNRISACMTSRSNAPTLFERSFSFRVSSAVGFSDWKSETFIYSVSSSAVGGHVSQYERSFHGSQLDCGGLTFKSERLLLGSKLGCGGLTSEYKRSLNCNQL